MTHANRTIQVTTKGSTNWKGNKKFYGAKTEVYPYPRDSVAQTGAARSQAATAYKAWLRNGQIKDEREMLHLTLDQSHRIVG